MQNHWKIVNILLKFESRTTVELSCDLRFAIFSLVQRFLEISCANGRHSLLLDSSFADLHDTALPYEISADRKSLIDTCTKRANRSKFHRSLADNVER